VKLQLFRCAAHTFSGHPFDLQLRQVHLTIGRNPSRSGSISQ